MAMRPEQIVAVLHNLSGKTSRLGTALVYDLVFTDRRTVGIVYGGAPAAAGWPPNPSTYPQTTPSLAWAPGYDVRALDAIVAGNPANFSLPYERIDHAKIGGVMKKSLSMKAGSDTYIFEVPKERLDELKTVVARRIPGADV